MAYRIIPGDSDPAESLRRIALGQIEKAFADLRDPALGRHEKVRQLRKRCKKLRGLVRLVRPGFDGYEDINATLRDAARALSHLRDTAALREAFDDLVEGYDGVFAPEAVRRIRFLLSHVQRSSFAPEEITALLSTFRETMERLEAQAPGWTLTADGFDAYAGGLRKTYGRARDAMKSARTLPDAEAMHEWRKRVKYHWYHARILAPIWPGPMEAHVASADTLGKLLGRHHDLAVLGSRLRAHDVTRLDRATGDVLSGLVALKMARVEQQAWEEGARLLTDPPRHLAERWRSYWTIWRQS